MMHVKHLLEWGAGFPAGGSAEMQEDSYDCCKQRQGLAMHVQQKSGAFPQKLSSLFTLHHS